MRKPALFFVTILFPSFFILFFFVARSASAASLSLVPQSGAFSVGQSFTETVYISSPDESMNAAQGTISFPTDKLSVLSVSKSNSIMTLWPQDPSFSNKDGVINFGGIRVNPGFQGSMGDVITITFDVKNTGKADISFVSGSILANDGKGTNILSGMNNSLVSLVAPSSVPSSVSVGSVLSSNLSPLRVTSVPSVSQGNWYNFNSIIFNWKLPVGVEAVRYDVSQDPDCKLSGGGQNPVSQASYDVSRFSDGIWYFFVSYESGDVWSAPAVVSFGLDKTPPEPFIIVRQNAGDVQGIRPVFQWAATDKTSGVAYYEAKIGTGDWFDPATIQEGSSYVLPVQSATDVRKFVVRAYDYAGNFREVSMNFSIGRPCASGSFACLFMESFSEWGWLIVLIFIILLAISYVCLSRLLRWRRRGFRAELLDFKNELRDDIERLEREGDEKGGKGTVDLRQSHLQKMKESVEKEVKHLESDVEKELKKMEKFKD
jgi:hypothetical protein